MGDRNPIKYHTEQSVCMPLDKIFDPKYLSATAALAASSGDDIIVSATCLDKIPYYYKNGEIWLLEPKSFMLFGEDIDSICFYRLISSETLGESKALRVWQAEHDRATTIRAVVSLKLVFGERKDVPLTQTTAEYLEDQILRIRAVRDEVIGILKSRCYNADPAHHGSEQEKFAASRIRLSYRDGDRSTLQEANARIDAGKAKYGFELIESPNGKPRIPQKGKRQQQWEELRTFTTESYLLCIESLDKIIEMMKGLTIVKTSIPAGCEIWHHVRTFEHQQARDKASELKLSGVDRIIIVRGPSGILKNAFQTRKGEAKCYICDKFLLFRGLNGMWNMVFESGPNMTIFLDHETLCRYRRFLSKVEQKYKIVEVRGKTICPKSGSDMSIPVSAIQHSTSTSSSWNKSWVGFTLACLVGFIWREYRGVR